MSWDNRANTKISKRLWNTIVSSHVQKDFVDDVRWWTKSEQFYVNRGMAYARGYLLSGPPGSGKTSLLKAIATEFNLTIYLASMADVTTEAQILQIFKGPVNESKKYLMCFEDVDRCPMFTDADGEKTQLLMRAFLNCMDGIQEASGRIVVLTANHPERLMDHPALMRAGRIDKCVIVDFCERHQLDRIFRQYWIPRCLDVAGVEGQPTEADVASAEGRLNEKEVTALKITPAKVVQYLMANPGISASQFEEDLVSLRSE